MTEAMCCPLQGCDEYATVANVAVRVARKEHTCCECRKPIARLDRYEHCSMLYDGSWSDFKTCLLCVEIRHHFSCGNGWLYEQMWSDLTENLFPDMKAGGVCMAGLSPAAKQKLIDARMEWYFDQDEVGDGAWEDWPNNRDLQRPRKDPPVEVESSRTVLFGGDDEW